MSIWGTYAAKDYEYPSQVDPIAARESEDRPPPYHELANQPRDRSSDQPQISTYPWTTSSTVVTALPSTTKTISGHEQSTCTCTTSQSSRPREKDKAKTALFLVIITCVMCGWCILFLPLIVVAFWNAIGALRNTGLERNKKASTSITWSIFTIASFVFAVVVAGLVLVLVFGGVNSGGGGDDDDDFFDDFDSVDDF